MQLLIGLGIPALLALGVLQGMRYRIVAHERAAGRKPPTTPLIFTGMAIAAVALIVAIIAGLQ